MDRFDTVIDHVKSCGINVIGPVPLGGRFWSAYFYDPNGIRLEIATSRAPAHLGVVPSALQTEEEARAFGLALVRSAKAAVAKRKFAAAKAALTRGDEG